MVTGTLLIIVAIIAAILYLIITNHNSQTEGFELPHELADDVRKGWATPLGSRIHVVLDKQCNELDWDYQQPSGNGNGNGCALVPCPNRYPDNTTCWLCCNYF